MAVKYSPFYRFSGFDTSTDGIRNWHDCTIKIIINDMQLQYNYNTHNFSISGIGNVFIKLPF
jgi:hypothetical protein